MCPQTQPASAPRPLRRLAVFAHFDREGRLRPFITHYLEALRPFVSGLWFVSTSGLAEVDQAALSTLCDRVQFKENIGQDFGMWQHAFHGIDWSAWDEVLLVNSSTYAPLHPLQQIFERIEQTPGDYFGITESMELDRHIQSYFLLFRPQVVRHESWARFWTHLLPFESKRQTIRSYEVGLTHWLKQHGFQSVALFPTQSLGRAYGLRRIRGWFSRRWRHGLRNPSLYGADLLLDAGCPFLKVEVLRDNPGRVSLVGLRGRIKALGYPEELITTNQPNLFAPR